MFFDRSLKIGEVKLRGERSESARAEAVDTRSPFAKIRVGDNPSIVVQFEGERQLVIPTHAEALFRYLRNIRRVDPRRLWRIREQSVHLGTLEFFRRDRGDDGHVVPLDGSFEDCHRLSNALEVNLRRRRHHLWLLRGKRCGEACEKQKLSDHPCLSAQSDVSRSSR